MTTRKANYLHKLTRDGRLFCWLLATAMTGSPVVAKEHNLHQETRQKTERVAVQPAVSSLEYVRVKMGKSIFLDPPEEEEPAVYVRVRDTSGYDFDLQQRVINLLAENGFQRARSLKKATYVLQANLLFAEEVSEAQLQQINDSDYDQSMGDVLGAAVAGTAVGGAVDIATGDHQKLGAGSIVGGLIGIVAATQEGERKKEALAEKKATKFFSAVVDIEVRQRAEGDVVRRGRSNVNQGTASDSSEGSLIGDSSFSETDEAGTQEVDEYTVRSKWVRYRARIVASAKGRHVTLEDVKGPMAEKLSNAMGGMF